MARRPTGPVSSERPASKTWSLRVLGGADVCKVVWVRVFRILTLGMTG